MTLRQFIKKVGGPGQAAIAIGVRESTIWRWLAKVSRPQGNNAKALRDLGVRHE